MPTLDDVSRIGGLLPIALLLILTPAACDSISIAPSCPAELRVGEMGPVQANEVKPGAIATYFWSVSPPESGVFADVTAATSTFEARSPGDALLRLVASDGLYQVISFCRTTIKGSTTVSVTFTASSTTPEEGDLVSLTCESNGSTEAVSFTITQTEGDSVGLSEVLEGIDIFTATQLGDFRFQCVGESVTGEQSEPRFLDLSVVPPSTDMGGTDDGTGGGRRKTRG